MRRVGLVAVLLITTLGVLAQEVEIDQPDLKIDREHTQWIDHVMRSIASLKPGMTRGDLLRVFCYCGRNLHT